MIASLLALSWVFLISLTDAQPQFTLTSWPALSVAGPPVLLAWTGDDTPVNITLVHGPVTNFQPVHDLDDNDSNTTYLWTLNPAIPDGIYALQITQSGQASFSPRFNITGLVRWPSYSLGPDELNTSAWYIPDLVTSTSAGVAAVPTGLDGGGGDEVAGASMASVTETNYGSNVNSAAMTGNTSVSVSGAMRTGTNTGTGFWRTPMTTGVGTGSLGMPISTGIPYPYATGTGYYNCTGGGTNSTGVGMGAVFWGAAAPTRVLEGEAGWTGRVGTGLITLVVVVVIGGRLFE